jgi:hypothetical protein
VYKNRIELYRKTGREKLALADERKVKALEEI